MPLSDSVIKARDVRLLRESHDHSVANLDSGRNGRNDDSSRLAAIALLQQEKEHLLKSIDTAKQEAYEKGFQEGLEHKRQDLLSAISAISAAVEEVTTFKQRFYDENEQDVLDLVLAVAEKVIHTELTVNRSIALAILKDSVKKVAEEDGLRIRLNPEDFEFVMEMKKHLAPENNVFKKAVFESDSSVRRGGVLLETEHLEVDARLEQQFEKVKESLKM